MQQPNTAADSLQTFSKIGRKWTHRRLDGLVDSRSQGCEALTTTGLRMRQSVAGAGGLRYEIVGPSMRSTTCWLGRLVTVAGIQGH